MLSENENKRITICACASRSFIDKGKVARLAALLNEEGYEVNVVADLCEKIEEQTTDLSDIAATTIIACYPRAIHSLFASAGITLAKESLNIRTETEETVLQQIDVTGKTNVNPERLAMYQQLIADMPVKQGTDAWFPTLDKSRCVDCGKCHDFCLFGVYTMEGKVVKVANPQNCKNNCPACARTCPTKAIIFPKYEKSPINGGLADEEQAISLDTKAVYAEALRTRLAYRRASVSLLNKNNQK